MKTPFIRSKLLGTLLIPLALAYCASAQVTNINQATSFTAIQPAINAANDFDTIWVDPGTYPGTLVIDRPLTLVGSGEGTTIIDVSAGATWGIYLNANQINLGEFSLQGGPSNNNYGIHSEPGISGVRIEQVTVTGCGRSGVDLNGINGSVAPNVLNNVTSINNGTGVGGFGLALSSCIDVTITGLTTSGNPWGDAAVYPSNPLFSTQHPDQIAFQVPISLSGGSGAISVQPTATPISISTDDPLDALYNASANVRVPASLNRVVFGLRSDALKNFSVCESDDAVAIAQLLIAGTPPFTWSGVTIRNYDNAVWEVAPDMSIQTAVNASSTGDVIDVLTGTFNEDVVINKSLTLQGAGAGNTVVIGPIGGPGATFDVDASNVIIDGFEISRAGNNVTDWNNPGLNFGGIAIQTVGNCEVKNCLITGLRTGIDINNSSGNNIHDNIITNNRTGMILRNQTDNTVVVDNAITDNWTVGILFLDASGGSNSPLQQAQNSTFSNNDLSGNWYGQVVDRQTGGSLPAPGSNLKDFTSNWFGANPPAVSVAPSSEPGYASQIPVVFGGSAVPPGGQPDILGEASANIVYCPYLDDVPGVGTEVTDLAIVCPANIAVPTSVDSCGAFVAVPIPEVTACAGFALSNDFNNTGNASGYYPEGVQTVIWTATDSYGSVMCTMTVTVQDAGAPVVQCPADITAVADSGQCSAVVIFDAPSAVETGYEEDWEDPAYSSNTPAGWNDFSTPLLRVPSGTGGITSAAGGAHGWLVPANSTSFSGTFGRLGGYQTSFGNGFVVSQDVYINLADPTVAANTYGWDLSVAANGQNGNHRRDFIIHTASNASGEILVAGSNNTNFTRRNDLATLNHYAITASGWYTFQYVFRDSAGALAVDLELLDASQTRLWKETRYNTTDLIASVVGGNRYIWFTFLAVEELAIDNTRLIRNLSTSTDFASGDSFPVGTTVVTASTTDICGNTSTCSFEITVEDQEAPVAVCQSLDVYLDASGNATLNAMDLDGGSSDNCGITSYAASTSSFSCDDLGLNSVTLTVVDSAGNSHSCAAEVNVIDTIAPAMACQDITLYLDAAGQAGIAPADVDAGSSDACSGVSLSLDISSFDCSQAGPNNVVLTGEDAEGNTASCTATVTVLDTLAPLAICSSPTLALNASGMLLLDPMDVDGGSTDNCGIVSRSVSPNMFDCDDAGIQMVTLTVTDAAGNSSSCSTTITLIDNTQPVAVCQNITVALNGAGTASITPAMLDAGSSDNCGIAEYSISKSSFDCSNIGNNNVIFSVRDEALNAAACVSTVTVIDTVAPVMACQNITVALDANGLASIVPADVDNGSADACSSISLSLDINSFTCANLGANTVTLMGTDASGNSASCTAIVTVVDETAPVVACQNITVYLDAAGNASILPAELDGGSTDACGIASLSLDVSSFTCSDIGANDVELTATDASGNSSSCMAIVTVLDTLAPVAICQNITVSLDALGDASILPSQLDGGSSDACGIASLALSQSTFDCSNVGGNSVVLTVTDLYGNSSSCSATVTVEDNTAPVAQCQDITVYLDVAGQASIAALDIDNGSSDACGIASLSLDISTFDCGDVGANAVVLTAFDVNGNSNTCPATVTVVDTVAPAAVCQSVTVYLDGAGQANLNPVDLDGGSSDACGLASFSASQVSFDCSEAGQNFVTLTVTDTEGNSNQCTATVNVVDTLAPDLSCPPDVTLYATASECGITYSFADPVASDNCAASVSQIAGLASGSLFPVGSTLLTFEAVDSAGNTSSCSYEVLVIDTIAPLISCVPDITINSDPGACDALVFFPNPSTSDNCAGSVLTQTAGLPSGSDFPVGVTEVEFSVTDASGNTASCGFSVTVIDNELPQIIFCPTNLSIPANPALCGAVVNFIPPSATDNCPGVSSSLTQGLPPGSVFPIGTTVVEYTFADASGNTVSCSFTVTVTYNTPTLATAVTNTSVAGGSDGAINLSVSGGIGPFSFLWSNGATTEDISGLTAGTYSVVVTDGNGCSFTAQASVVDAPCLPPTGLVAIPVNPVKVNVSWNPVAGALNYNLQGRKIGAPNWANKYLAATATNVGTLDPGGTYEWRVRVQCANSAISAFSVIDTFTLPTPREALVPDRLEVYPNPVTTSLRAEYETQLAQEIRIAVLDQLGRVMVQELRDVPQGISVLEYDAASWAEGLYFISVLGDQGALEYRFAVFHP